MRHRVDKVFNQTFGIHMNIPEKIRPATAATKEAAPLKQHHVDEPGIDLSFLQEVRTPRSESSPPAAPSSSVTNLLQPKSNKPRVTLTCSPPVVAPGCSRVVDVGWGVCVVGGRMVRSMTKAGQTRRL
jgi:hypothetical protein